MDRRAKPKKGEAEARRPPARKSPKDDSVKARDVEKRLAEALEQLQTRDRELAEAREQLTAARAQAAESQEQQTATGEVLRAISRAQTDAQPVFDIIASSARHLCGASYCQVQLYDGDVIHLAALDNIDPVIAETIRRAYPVRVGEGSLGGRVVGRRAIVQIPDILEDRRYEYVTTWSASGSGVRSLLGVPMLKDSVPIGVIAVGRRVPGTFSETQIELLKTFADQAVIAIENVRLFTEQQALNRNLTDALDQQTATSEILQVISRSPTDIQPVFDTIVRSAVQLCDGLFSALFRYDGELLSLVAHHNYTPEALAQARRLYPTGAVRAHGSGRAILDRVVVHIPDVQLDPEYHLQDLARSIGFRSSLFVPMLLDGDPIGVVMVARAQAGPFSGSQIELLRTFANQAVIAIENVRLFTELQTSNGELTEALERQTATAEILRVISTSPTVIEPVLERMAESAVRFCQAQDASIFRVDGDRVQVVAHHGPIASLPIGRHVSLTPGTVTGRTVLERRPVHVADLQLEDETFPEAAPTARRLGQRATLSVPLLREDVAIGGIMLRRLEAMPFNDKQITLLQTFADQAVIAIENVRLFRELEERNRALTKAHAQVSEALERQTATADILRVISQSQADVRPVFDAIVDNAMRLFRAWSASVFRAEGELIYLIAARGGLPEADEYMQGLRSGRAIHEALPVGRCIATRAVVHIANVESDPTLDQTVWDVARLRGWRSELVAPMLRDGQPIGVIVITRPEAGAFSPAEIALLQTFADQAVIAIENARLLGELRARTGELTRSVEQLTALGEVGRAVSSTLDLETVLTTIVSRAVQLSGLDGGVVFEYDGETEEFVQRAATEQGGELAAARRARRIRRGEGVVGQTAATLEPAQVPDIVPEGAYASPLRENLVQSGVRAVLAVPMLWEARLIGSLVVSRNTPGEFPPATVDLLRTFATQSALAIQNARLFREVEQKSRELAAASQHKSEFLANMSHELRTPLNAIIGFSEVLNDRLFGELNEKQGEYLQDIHASGQHLLSLINDILDLSKIEAGRMELEVSDFHPPTAIENALILVRERAGRRGIRLGQAIDERLGMIRGDERKVKQVLLNLLSNALKFTPEGGRIEVRAAMNEGMVEISVTDTGVGIAPEDQEAIFEEFRQVGTADKKVEGTGLGLALSRKFIELHGGRIWVKSQVGQGSTFTFTLPMQRDGGLPLQ